MATLADVARHAGVSKGTVSRVLNNPNGIVVLPATLERIRHAVAELQYRPNALAQGLATGRTHTLGLLVRSMTDPNAARMLAAVETRARTLQYRLMISSEPEGFPDVERVDGVLAIGTPDEPRLAGLEIAKPTVYVCNRSTPPPFNYVGWNDTEAAYGVAQYLLGLGHRCITKAPLDQRPFGDGEPSAT